MVTRATAVFDLVTGSAMGEWRFSATPVWLWDPAARRPVWANGPALHLWRATNFGELAERADPAAQPGLAQLEKTARNLPATGFRVERIRLYVAGSPASLTCRCTWQPIGEENHLLVAVLDRGAAGASPRRDDPSDLPRRLLAGLDAPAIALGEDGTLVFANMAAGDVFFEAGDAAAPLPALADIARHAFADGRYRGRILGDGAPMALAAVRVDPNGVGEPFVAMRPCDTSEREVEAAPEPEDVAGTSAPSDQGDNADLSRRALEPGAAPASGNATNGPAGGPDNILPFRGALALSPSQLSELSERTVLDAHERDAFRALAKALGARIEGDDGPDGDIAPAPPAPRRAVSLSAIGELAPGRRRETLSAQESEALLAHLPIGLLVYRRAAPLYANRAFLELLDYRDLPELQKIGDVTALLPKIMNDPRITDLRTSETGDQRATTLVAFDRKGIAIPVLARLQAIRWAGESAILLSIRPAEAALAQPAPPAAQSALPVPAAKGSFNPAELAMIVKLSTDGIVVVGKEGLIEAISERAQALLRKSASQVAGKLFESLFTGDSRIVATDYLDGLRYHGVTSLLGEGRKVRARLPNGDDLPLHLTMGELSDDPARRFCAILRDISQWTRTESEHIRAREAAETASAHKTDLLARVSHEIRTPLNSIIGFSEVMQESRFGKIGSDRYRDYVRDIHSSGKHLLGLVNDLLDLSKVEAGKLELNFTRLDVNDLALQCVRLMRPEATKGRIIVRSSLTRMLPAVVADHRSLRQILLNLLSNAIKFTLPGGQVVLSTSLSKQGEVQIRVRDTGVGMEEKDIVRALEPFGQVASAASSRAPGTGLGLPLTKALAEVNRAHFRIESKSGEGTLAEITFPSQRVLAD